MNSGKLTQAIQPQAVELRNYDTQTRLRFVPFLRDSKIRMTIGFILLVLSSTLAGTLLGKGRVETLVSITALAWILAVLLTDKYVHKYPRRYFTYLIASHLKSALVMAFFLWILGTLADPFSAPRDVLWTGFILFVLADVLASVPFRRDTQHKHVSLIEFFASTEEINSKHSGLSGSTQPALGTIHTKAILTQARSRFDTPLASFLERNLPISTGDIGDVLFLDDIPPVQDQSHSAPAGLLVGRTRINDVRRLNQFLLFCVNRITMGGYFVVRYMPHENVAKNLKRRYTGLLYWPVFISHFIWYRAIPKLPWFDRLYFLIPGLDSLCLSLTKTRNRALSKAEVWGRLAYCGMHVIAESKDDGEIYVLAQRVGVPVRNGTISYYPIVALEKVGLDGTIIRMHKLRTMYPFSEFLQKRIFEDNGLGPTGKFANDFRLTEVGAFLRRYWLDELPQLFDWLRGDIKLVGIRATSPHFLSLYPKNFLELYLQIKPGLIPPIFDSSTNGFDDIVKVELTYLKRYLAHPLRTDVSYFVQTFTDIVFRGLRSK